jgi:1-acyl-sn-glycerol-3-phosphate acyltransferase
MGGQKNRLFCDFLFAKKQWQKQNFSYTIKKMLKTIIFKIVLALHFVAWAPILLVGLVSARLSRKFIVMDAAGVLFWLRHIAGIRYRVHGDQVPNAIIASKHMSILEVAVLVKLNPRAFFIIKRELMMIPIYGWAFWRMGFLGVNRTPGATNMKILADRAAKKIRSGMPLVIFPEGTRARPGAGVKLRRGLLFIAETAGIPIQPVGTDAGLYWPKRGRLHGGMANIWLEPALPSNATLDEITSAIARHSA